MTTEKPPIEDENSLYFVDDVADAMLLVDEYMQDSKVFAWALVKVLFLTLVAITFPWYAVLACLTFEVACWFYYCGRLARGLRMESVESTLMALACARRTGGWFILIGILSLIWRLSQITSPPPLH